MDRRTAWPPRIRSLPLPAAGIGRPGISTAVSIFPALGVLRFLVSLARGSGLPRAALAQGRDRRTARRCLALLGTRCPVRRLPAPPDRSLSSKLYSDIRLDRASPRQREILGSASRMAREDGAAPGRSPRLAKAYESDQSRSLHRNRAG